MSPEKRHEHSKSVPRSDEIIIPINLFLSILITLTLDCVKMVQFYFFKENSELLLTFLDGLGLFNNILKFLDLKVGIVQFLLQIADDSFFFNFLF